MGRSYGRQHLTDDLPKLHKGERQVSASRHRHSTPPELQAIYNEWTTSWSQHLQTSSFRRTKAGFTTKVTILTPPDRSSTYDFWYLFIEVTSCLHMIYAIVRLNILGMLSILIEKTERSDTTNLQASIFNIQFRLVRVGYYQISKLFPRRICHGQKSAGCR